MINARDAFLKSRDFGFQINQDGVIQVWFGPTQVCMTLDSVYDLQYDLAAFLAGLELREYPREQEDEAPGIMEGRQTLEALAAYPKSKRINA